MARAMAMALPLPFLVRVRIALHRRREGDEARKACNLGDRSPHETLDLGHGYDLHVGDVGRLVRVSGTASN